MAILFATFEAVWKPEITKASAQKYVQENRPETYWAERGDRFWIAEIGGAVVGFVDWEANFINALHVLPEHAGKGIGRALLGVAEERIQAEGYSQIRLETDTFNTPSRSFYRRLGYEEIDQYPDLEWESDLVTVLLEKTC